MRRKYLIFVFFLVLNGVYAQENCSNGVDDNGDGLIDCNDPQCQFAATIERGCNCDDGIDNDSDGQIDIYDPDCASFYGLTFVSDGQGDCSIPPPDSLDYFQFIDTPGQTQQNTVDTQSKMAIGDLNGDGIPEVIATSKWNKEVRVISSGGDGIHPAGDIIDQFGTTGGDDIFPPGNYVYELELAIADIDGDGDGEIFAIASRRQTPNSEPNGYFMVALTYENEVLTPMYDAVYIDEERPGMIAIADFDGDGLSEIYFKDRIYAAETGALLAQGTGDWNTEVNSAPVAVNVLPGTENLELVVGNIIYNVPDLSNRNPSTPINLTVAKDLNDLGAQFYPKVLFDAQEYGETNYSSTSVADVNGDGNIDVVLSGAVGSTSGNTAIFYWDVANDTYSVYEPPDLNYPGGWPWGTSRPNLGDANGDGQLDILFIAGNQLFALTLDAGGNLVPLWPTPRIINDSRSGIVAVTIYDFENDGHPEVVYRDSQQLVIVDGDTGQEVFWSTVCQSHTMTEGPIIADVDGNGSTDITIPCFTSQQSFNINAQIQQQALGGLRIYYSAENLWLPTRKVWNQSGYFVVNVNDDLTIPRHQMDQSIIFGDDPCFNGVPGPIRPFNIFLNQAPSIGPDGCPFYPAPDISFVGDNPNAEPGDPDYKDPNDPTYYPAVNVIPPICGNLGIEVEFNIINDGALSISSSIPVSFWDGDPTIDPPPADPATLLYTTNLQLNDFQVGDSLHIDGVTFNSTGKAFRLYIVLNDDGSSLPVDPGGSGLQECRIENNVYYFDVIPDPFEVDIEKIQDNIKCEDSAPDNGELRAVVTRNGVPVTDYSDFAFQWYDGIGVANPIPAPDGTTNVLTDLAEGDYSLVVTNTDKGCASIPTDTSVVRIGVDPEITIVENSPQSQCDPPNGELEVFITGGNTGYTFEWFDRLLNPLNITGSVASNLIAGEYIVSVYKDGCTKTASYTLAGPVFPIVDASVLQDVVDCANMDSGVITAEASINGIPQDSTDYTFRWYEWDSVAMDLGSVLAPIHGTGPTRSGLLPGEYAVVARDENTGCETDPPVRVVVQDLTVIPDIVISEVAPQTSCDPANPNGVLRADGYVNGVLQDPSALTFEWFDGDNTLPSNLITTVSGVNGEIAEGIANSGLPYTVRVTTPYHCSSTLAYRDLTENLEIPELSVTTFDNSICDATLALGGAYNGRIEASATLSGVPITDFTDYTFTWYDGDDMTSDPVLTTTSPDGDILYGLDAGRYTVTLERTSTSCISDPVIVEIFDVTVPPVVNITEIPSTNCAGGTPNGELTAQVDVGGTLSVIGYSFTWFEGVDTSPSGTPVTNVSGIRDETAEQLSGNDTYTVLVINDTTGCSITESYVVTDDSQLPLVDLTKIDNTICDTSLPTVDAYNGSATATVTERGTIVSDYTNYSFEWFDGPATTDPEITTTSPDGDILQEIPGGFYTVSVTNNVTGCISDPLSIEVMDVLDLPVISLNETPATNCDPAFANGEVAASVGGITNGFIFKWVSGIDVNGAAWSPVSGAQNQVAEALLGGDLYTVQVTNELTGCANTEGIVITDSSALPVVDLAQTPNTICDPALSGNPYNGRIQGTTTYYGNPVVDYTNYSFSLYEGNDTSGPLVNTLSGVAADFTALENGSYTVQAYDQSLGCYSDPVSIEVLEDFGIPLIDITEVPATNCDPLLANGELYASVQGTTLGYGFKWVSGTDTSAPALDTQPVISGLSAGNTYTVRVTIDSTGCYGEESRVVSDSSTVPEITLNQIPNSICDTLVAGVPYNGAINGTTQYNGIPVSDYSDYYFNLFEGTDTTGVVQNSVTASALNFIELENGLYTARAYNTALGCYSDPVTIEVLENFAYPVINLTERAATNCDPALANGQVTADVGGSIAGHIFKWVEGLNVNGPEWSDVSGSANQTAESLTAGNTYTVKATINATGCFETESILLRDSSELPLISLAQTPNSICDAGVAGVPYNGSVSGTTTYRGLPVSDYNDYYFNIFEGNDTTGVLNNTISGSAINFTELQDGIYTVRAYNTVLGCYGDPETIEVLDNFVFPAIDIAEVAATNCDPLLANGELYASVQGTTVGYGFKWVEGIDTNAPALDTQPGITGLLGGNTYTVKVTTDSTGCFGEESQIVSDSSSLPVIVLNQSPNSICDTLVAGVPYDGTVNGNTLYNGVAVSDYSDYYFNLFEGNDTTGVLNQTIIGSALNFTELQDGIYTARAYNTSLGCYGDPETIEVLDNFVYPVISLTERGATNCDPSLPNGSLTASDAGVIAGRAFKWVEGLDLSVPAWTPVSGAENETAESLTAGITYAVQVTIDATGCFETAARMMSDSSEVPILSLTQTPNTICDDAIAGAFDGAIAGSMTYYGNLVADFTPYDFNLFAGSDTTGVLLGSVSGAIPEFIELQNGDYTARAYDFATGCYSSPVTIAVQDNTVLPDILITKEPNSSCDDTQPNGNIQAFVDAIGNTADHDFIWFNGTTATAGNETTTIGGVGEIISLMGNQNYTVEVTSQLTGCVNTLSTFLNHIIPSYDLSIAVTDIMDCNNGGSILAEVDSSGTGPVADYTNYQFYWYRGDVVNPGSELPEISRNLTEIAPGISLYSEDYTVYAVNTYTHCITNDVTGFVAAPAPLFDIQSEINFYPSDCETDEGALTAWVDTGGTRDYDNYNFYWYEGQNINPGSNFYTDPSVAFTGDSLNTDFPDGSLTYLGSPQPNRNVQEGPTIYNLNSGAFSVVVQDRITGCKEYIEIPLPSIITPPTLLGTVQGSTLCPYTVGDGIVTAAINPDSLVAQNLFNSDYDFYLYEGVSTDAGDLITGPLLGAPDRVTYTELSNVLAPGYYTVVANEKVSGSYCPSVPLTLEIEPLALPPVVSLNSALINNSSCDSTQVNGEIDLLVEKDPDDLTGPSTYGLTWTSTASTVPPDISGVAAGPQGPYTNLNFGTYDVTVVDENSSCETTETYVLYNEPPEILVDETTLQVTDKYFCVPSGSIEITNIEVGGNAEPLGNFFFEWFDGSGNLASNSPVGPPADTERIDSLNYPTIHEGTYYVVVTKDPAVGGPGAGCSSVPFDERIVDRTIDPTVILAQTANLACDSSFATGTISLTANTGGSIASDYEFTIKSTVLADSIHGFTNDDGTPGTWTEIYLGPGQYSVAVRDVDNQCISNNTLTINDNPSIPYIELPDLTILPQTICDYDGSVTVNAVRVNGLAEIPGTGPGEVNYIFTWYDNQPIPPDLGVTGNILDTASYPLVEAGAYYFKALRRNNAHEPGEGCETAPFRVEIPDVTVDPTIVLAQTANQACDLSFATGSLTMNLNTGGTVSSDYAFIINSTALGGPINGFTSDDGTPESWTESNLGPGQYNVEVVDVDNFCINNKTITINNNPAVPYVEAADLTILPQAICANDGSITVDAIQINGVPEIPGVVNYDFTWYAGSTSGPDLGVTGNVLDTTTYAGVQAGTYYFTALRDNNANEPGEGCETVPFPAEIEDVSVDPTIVLAQTANQACDLSFATGSITLNVNTGGTVSSDYGYTITSSVLGGPLNGFTSDDGTPESWTEINLGPGQYNVQVTDVDNFCVNNRSITINNNPAVPYAEAPDLTILPQAICANDGSITVDAIRINGVPETPGVVNYEFTWYAGSPTGSDLGVTGNVLDTTNYPGIGAGTYYFTALRDNNANQPGEGCETAPFPAEIDDVSVDPTLILAQTANQACDLSFATGSITLDVNTGGVVSSDYGYTITSTALGGPLNGFTNDDGSPASWTEINLGPGQYNVRVTDVDNFCTSSRVITVNDHPAVPYVESADLTILPQAICSNDGSITVNAIRINGVSEVPGVVNYLFSWHEGQATAPDLGVTGNVLDTANYAGIRAGTYYFTAIRDENLYQPGEGCETAPFAAVIEDVSVDPVLALTSTANQSCDTSTVANGTITAMITPGSNSLGNFNYTWLSFPTSRPQEYIGGSGTTNEQFVDLSYGQYRLEVEDENTRCITSRSVTINNNPVVPVISDYLVNDQAVCFNDGSIIVTAITPGDTSQYDFTWYDGVTNFNGNSPIAGVSGALLDTTQYASIQAGDYYFTATKTDPSDPVGFACISSPVKATIRDLSVDPFLVLTPAANQNCDLSFANGSLTALATTNGVQGPSYSFTLTSSVLGAPLDSLNNDSQVIYDFLRPGTYNVRVVDDNTLCAYNRSATINDSPVYLDINDVLYTVNDQAICAPDGSVVITEITDQGISEPLTNYAYTWYEGNTNLNNDNPLAATESYLDTTNYVSIGAGVYFFTVTKATGTYVPGEGCESAPLRADIYDLSTDPNVQFVSVDNTSCDPNLPNGEISASAFENDGSSTDIYSFLWTLNGNPLPAGILQSDASNSSVLTNAPQGNYQVTVINTSRTQCQVNSGSPVDFVEIEPNIIVVDVIDPLNCNPTGQLEVTEIWLGGIPANVNDFEYEWYQGNFTPGDLILDSLGNPVTSPVLANQYPEKYYVMARNIGTACESNPKEANITPADIIYPEIYIDAIAPQTSCDPVMPNAALMATVDGGNDDTNPNYLFEWFNSLDGSGPVLATTSSIYGLGADNYSVTVLDLITNCTSTDYYITEDAVELYKPVISVAANPRDNCAINNGTASAEVINVNGNFEFNWYIGNQPGTVPDYTGPSISGLQIGQYTVVATEMDTTFCLSDPVTVTIDDERMKPVITITEDNPLTDCWEDSPNGQFTATVNGMVGGYTFEWYVGSDTTGVADYMGSTWAGLSPQTYTVVVTDNRTQCDEVATRTITDNTVTPPMPDPEVVQHYQSCIQPDGWVRASVGGDVVNYTFSWYDGTEVSGSPDHNGINYMYLLDGFYTVTAMDMITGCVSPGVPVEVLDLRDTVAFTYNVVPANCEENNGSIELVWENDVPVREIIWYDPVTGGMLDQGSAIYNYPPGFYEVVVTSVYGCETQEEMEIPIDIFEFNGISANGDGRNDYFEIACITEFPNNNVKIFNRAGQLVFEANHYDNISTVFKGIGENGMYLMGKELPDGTYFYIIDKGDGSEPIPGYLELIR